MDDFIERMYRMGLHDGMTKTFKTIRNIMYSLESEGFEFTAEDYKLIQRVVIDEEISIDEAVSEIIKRYK